MSNEIMQVGLNTELLFQEAIKNGAGVDALERLMQIRRELKAELSQELFYQSLARFQAECPQIEKKKEVMNKDGRSVRFSYAPLDHIVKVVKPYLRDCGFSYTVETEQTDTSVKAICHLHHEAGYTMKTEFSVPVDTGGFMTAPQKVASALTYAKRYAFCNATGILTSDEDDDSMASEYVFDGATDDQIVTLESYADDMDEVGKRYINDQIKSGLTKVMADKLIARAKAKVGR